MTKKRTHRAARSLSSVNNGKDEQHEKSNEKNYNFNFRFRDDIYFYRLWEHFDDINLHR